MGDYGPTLRRNRIHPALRELLADVGVTANDLMYPVFVCEGSDQTRPVASMPGVAQYSVDSLIGHLAELVALGLKAVIVFGVIPAEAKDASGSHIAGDDSIVARAVRTLKECFPDLLVAVDVCFCEYTSHGHCGVSDAVTTVHNEATVANLGTQALTLAAAGADLIAPSGMMDQAVAGIREALDEGGYGHLPIMAYAVKYASKCYGPFRDAAGSSPEHGDRKQYQMDYRRDVREALLEAEADVAEGADIVMVKPGILYLDVLARLKAELLTPLAVYHVSGEYAMLKAAGAKGWIDEAGVLFETMTAFKRAGASLILTYSAPDILKLMAGGRWGT